MLGRLRLRGGPLSRHLQQTLYRSLDVLPVAEEDNLERLALNPREYARERLDARSESGTVLPVRLRLDLLCGDVVVDKVSGLIAS